jgi:glutamyl-tRNA reductase
MKLVAVGVSHRTAPVELREAIDFSRTGLDTAVTALASRQLAREAVVVSTCNRAEIYAAADADAAGDVCAHFIAEYHALPWEKIAPHIFVLRGADAARHLFRVAAGLDSLVVGEPQILGQVKEAFAAATGVKHTGALTNRLFNTAFTVGKRVRSETGLGEGAVSVSYAAIALARKIFRDLKGLSVLILGAGEMAKLTGVHLQAHQVRHIMIASRTAATAEALAAQLGGRAVPWAALSPALTAADIVVTATGATEPVLTRARIEEAMRPRRGRPLLSSTSRSRATSKPTPDRSIKCFSTTSTICGRSSRRTWRAAPRSSNVRNESSARSWSVSRPGCSPAKSFRPSSLCVSGSRRSDARSFNASSPRWRDCRRKRVLVLMKSPISSWKNCC